MVARKEGVQLADDARSLLLLVLIGLATPITRATAQEGPNAPSGLAVVNQRDRSVTLAWTPPSTGAVPTGYVIEAGVNPGEARVSIPAPSITPAITLNAPQGIFFVRVHALAGNTRSPASNEIQVFVDVPAPPSAPANLTGLVEGSNVAFSWTNTFAGGAPTSLWLNVTGTITTAFRPGPIR